MQWIAPSINTVVAPQQYEAMTCPPLGSAELLDLTREERLECWRENGQPEGGSAE